jgi:hypothetical protein
MTLHDVLDQWRTQLRFAQERIQLFETGQMSTEDIGPLAKDTTRESIEFEKTLIETLEQGIESLTRHVEASRART